MTTPAPPDTMPSPAELLALAERVGQAEHGMTVPRDRCWLYKAALEALAREQERKR